MAFLIFVILIIIAPILYLLWITNTRDAPWLPMEAEVVDRVMKIASVGPNDIFYDLGSGDGRLVIAAAMRGAIAYGVELDRWRALYSRVWIKILGLDKKAKIINKNLFDVDLSKATVVSTYLLPATHQKLKNKLIKECAKGTKVIALGFEYENWNVIKNDYRGNIYGPIMLYEI